MTLAMARVLPARLHQFGVLMAVVVALLLTGCSSQQLYGDLTEEHANEMVAILDEAGIAAEKSELGEGKWKVTVAGSDMARASSTLRANGLPREKFESSCTVFKKEGITSTPVEDRARLNCAKTQELSDTINKMEGVLSAKVHLAMPEADPLSKVAQPSGASVYVKYRTGFDVRSKQSAIKTLVSNSVEGLNFDRVSVYMEPAQSLPVATRRSESLPWGDVLRIILGIIALGLLALAGRAWLKGRKSKSLVKAEN
jgi:type III secretion protein J